MRYQPNGARPWRWRKPTSQRTATAAESAATAKPIATEAAPSCSNRLGVPWLDAASRFFAQLVDARARRASARRAGTRTPPPRARAARAARRPRSSSSSARCRATSRRTGTGRSPSACCQPSVSSGGAGARARAGGRARSSRRRRGTARRARAQRGSRCSLDRVVEQRAEQRGGQEARCARLTSSRRPARIAAREPAPIWSTRAPVETEHGEDRTALDHDLECRDRRALLGRVRGRAATRSRIRWPVEEIGRYSVMPSTRPRITACHQLKRAPRAGAGAPGRRRAPGSRRWCRARRGRCRAARARRCGRARRVRA